MANAPDESAYLGSSVSGDIAPRKDAIKEKSKEIKNAQSEVRAVLAPASEKLLQIIRKTKEEAEKMSVVTDRASQRQKRTGQTYRECLADEMLVSEGRLEVLAKLEALLTAAKKSAGGNDE